MEPASARGSPYVVRAGRSFDAISVAIPNLGVRCKQKQGTVTNGQVLRVGMLYPHWSTIGVVSININSTEHCLRFNGTQIQITLLNRGSLRAHAPRRILLFPQRASMGGAGGGRGVYLRRPRVGNGNVANFSIPGTELTRPLSF